MNLKYRNEAKFLTECYVNLRVQFPYEENMTQHRANKNKENVTPSSFFTINLQSISGTKLKHSGHRSGICEVMKTSPLIIRSVSINKPAVTSKVKN